MHRFRVSICRFRPPDFIECLGDPMNGNGLNGDGWTTLAHQKYHLITANGLRMGFRDWPLVRAHYDQQIVRQQVGICGQGLEQIQWRAVYAVPVDAGSLSFSVRMDTLVSPQPIQAAEPRLLTIDAVALVLGKSKWCVYDLVRQGRLHALRIGRTLRFKQQDIDAFLDR